MGFLVIPDINMFYTYLNWKWWCKQRLEFILVWKIVLKFERGRGSPERVFWFFFRISILTSIPKIPSNLTLISTHLIWWKSILIRVFNFFNGFHISRSCKNFGLYWQEFFNKKFFWKWEISNLILLRIVVGEFIAKLCMSKVLRGGFMDFLARIEAKKTKSWPDVLGTWLGNTNLIVRPQAFALSKFNSL
jgi:hypothetical protein